MVSIVLCTYNGEKYLHEQLDSLLQQTYTDIEIIIVDDASSDDTVSILKKYAEKDKRIRFYQNEKNLGYNGNFLKGFGFCTHQNIAVCDQDDIWDMQKIEKMMTAWKPGVQLIYCNSVMFEKELPAGDKYAHLSRRYEGTDGRKLALYNTVSGHAMIFKKEVLEDVYAHFPGNIYYDWWLAVYASYHGGVQYFPETLVYQRRHGNNASGGKTESYRLKDYRHCYNQIIEKHLAAFVSIPGKQGNHQHFFEELAEHWQHMMHHSFSRPLFNFIMKYRKQIFFKKRRKIGLISYVKHSYLLATNKGIKE